MLVYIVLEFDCSSLQFGSVRVVGTYRNLVDAEEAQSYPQENCIRFVITDMVR